MPMEIIPVIDIKQGQVVHAVAGERRHYRPLITNQGNTPVDIILAFLSTYAFRTMYIADLDALEQQDYNTQHIERLYGLFQAVMFWIDQGLPASDTLQQQITNRTHVIGSETNISAAELDQIVIQRRDVILSLDFKGNDFQGSQSLLENVDSWPSRVIVMNLKQIGTDQGPDYECIRKIKEIAGSRSIYVAGGVRHQDDLMILNDIGVDGVLVASALHNQQIYPDRL